MFFHFCLNSLCAPGKDAVRLDAFFSLEQRIPNTCSTRSGQACVFPFKYKGRRKPAFLIWNIMLWFWIFKGVEYLKCTYADSPTPWCATKVFFLNDSKIFYIRWEEKIGQKSPKTSKHYWTCSEWMIGFWKINVNIILLSILNWYAKDYVIIRSTCQCKSNLFIENKRSM